MKLRISLLLGLAAVAGLFRGSGIGGLLESSGPDLSSIMVHLAAPALLGVLVAFLWRSTPWQRQLLPALGCLVLAEAVRFVVFHGPYWHRILTDSKNQFLLLASLSVQLAAGLLALGAAKWLLQRYEKRPV